MTAIDWRKTLKERLEIGTLRETSYQTYEAVGNLFEDWLKAKSLDFNSLIDECKTDEGGQKACKLINEFINVRSRDSTFKTKQSFVSQVGAIFRSCNRRLPPGKIAPQMTAQEEIRSAVEATHQVSVITSAELVRFLHACNPMERALFLVLFQSFMDQHTFTKKFNYMWEAIAEQVRTKSYPIQIPFMGGRKTNPNPYYTFLEKDAVEALYEYVFKHRPGGEPKSGEAIFLKGQAHAGKLRPVDRKSIYWAMKSVARSIGFVDEKGRVFKRFSPHKLRRSAKTLWSKAANELGIDYEKFTEFFMGHSRKVDPLGYNKMLEDWEWVKERIAPMLSYVNVLSGSTEIGKITIDRRILEFEARSRGMTLEELLQDKMKTAGIKMSIETVADQNHAIELLLTGFKTSSNVPFQSMIVNSEAELLERMNRGYEFVAQINDGKFIIIRK